MEITDIINYQLAKIESLLREDLSDGSVTLNYLICENETKFLDKYSLTKYIRKKKIRNTIFFEIIAKRCKRIIQLINHDLKDLHFTEENFAFKDLSNPDNPIFLSTQLNFHAIYLTENKFHFYYSELSKQTFLKDFKSNWYDIYEIAQRCNLILNIILSSYPEINFSDETKPELTLRQVALLYIYNGDHITPENNDAIAKKYLHKTGHKLQQHYNDYYKSNSRKSFSKRKDSLLVKDIEKVIQYLPIEKKEKPTKEAELLRNMIQNNDYPSL